MLYARGHPIGAEIRRRARDPLNLWQRREDTSNHVQTIRVKESPGSSQPRISPDDLAKAMFSAAQSSVAGGQICHEKCASYFFRMRRRSLLVPSSMTMSSRLG